MTDKAGPEALFASQNFSQENSPPYSKRREGSKLATETICVTYQGFVYLRSLARALIFEHVSICLPFAIYHSKFEAKFS